MLKGFLNLEIADQLDAKGAGLGDYTLRFQFRSRNAAQSPVHTIRSGEDVSYTIQLIVLDYTIVPFVDLENI